jgi:hypothetical protein
VESQEQEKKEDGIMKKGMVVMIIVVVLSFLVSPIAVSPSFAKQATQTTPTSKQAPQQGPAQAPQTQTIKPPAALTKTYEKAKDIFWELEPLHCSINGVSRPCNCMGTTAAINVIVTPGQPLTINCYYRVKTPPINDITEADAKAWGWGRSYTLCYDLIGFDRKEDVRILPKFTWYDVKIWKKGGQGNAPKIWTEHMVRKLTMPAKLIGMFVVDFKDVIKELHEGMSNACCIAINQ